MVHFPQAARPAAPSGAGYSALTQRPTPAAGLSRSAEAGTRTVGRFGLRPDGSPYQDEVAVPALPLFDGACSAFARGTLLQSAYGEIAVEDLRPGDTLWTRIGRSARVMWIGMAGFAPQESQGEAQPLVRIMPDSFGEGRPNAPLTLGPGARILQTPPALRGLSGAGGLLTRASRFVDAVNVIEVTPPTPVTLFHVVLDRHAIIRAAGLECESHHPGTDALRQVSPETRARFLSLFHHITLAADFGPLIHPRAPDAQADATGAGN